MKKLILLAILALTLVAFAACSGDDDSDRTTLVMGTSAGFFPFEFIADYGEGVIGQYAGIDLSLVARIAEELDVDITVLDMDFGGLIPALEGGSIDFIAAAMTIRPDRAETVNFTVPYFNAGQSILVLQGSPITSMADLDGLIVGAQLATTGEMAITDAQNEGRANFQNIATYTLAVPGVQDLLSGSIDAFVVDAPVARGFVANHPDRLVAFADPDFFGPEQFGMAFNKNDTELLAQFNEVLTRLIQEGFVDYLYEHYTTHFAHMAE